MSPWSDPVAAARRPCFRYWAACCRPIQAPYDLRGVSLYALSSTARTRLRRDRIGFVFQTFNLVPYLTALENVELPLYLAGRSASDQQQRALALFERVGLQDRLSHKPCELSVGQQQRVALARTVANNPGVILADEPTGNLDEDSRGTCSYDVRSLHRDGGTVVMVTHDTVAASRAHSSASLCDGSNLRGRDTRFIARGLTIGRRRDVADVLLRI